VKRDWELIVGEAGYGALFVFWSILVFFLIMR